MVWLSSHRLGIREVRGSNPMLDNSFSAKNFKIIREFIHHCISWDRHAGRPMDEHVHAHKESKIEPQFFTSANALDFEEHLR